MRLSFVLITELLCCLTIRSSELQEPKPVNLVIFNSFTERNSDRPFPPVTGMLAQALCDNQLIICTKQLWHTFQQIHKKLTTFDQSHNILQQEFKKIVQEFNKINPILNQNKDNQSKLLTKLQPITKTLTSSPYWNLFSSDLVYYTAYEIMKAQSYMCKEINDDYLLFIPKNLTIIELSPETQNIAREAFINPKNFTIGMNFVRLPNYNHVEENVPSKSIRYSLSATLETIALKPLIWKKYGDQIYSALPRMNVFIMAHGTYAPIQIAEMSESAFISSLDVLNHAYDTKCLTIISCFAGGVIQKAIESLKNKHFFDAIPYPIVLGAGLFTTFRQIKGRILMSTNEEILDSIYNLNDVLMYGPAKQWNHNGLFNQFFDYLNQTETYSITSKNYRFQVDEKTHSQRYHYTAHKPAYTEAVQLFNQTADANVARLNNVFVIRYPNTRNWFAISNINSKIKEITWIDAATKSLEISIPAEVQDIFLKTSYIPIPIFIQGNLKEMFIIPTIIHKELLQRVDYYIEKLQTNNDYTIIDLVHTIFEEKSIRYLAQPFAIFIKQLTLGNNKYSDVLFFVQGDTKGRVITTGSDREWSWNRTLFCIYKDNRGKDSGIMWNITGPDGQTLTENKSPDSLIEIAKIRALIPDIEKNIKKESLVDLDSIKDFINIMDVQSIQKEQEYRKEKAHEEKEKNKQQGWAKNLPSEHTHQVDQNLLINALELATILA